MFRRAAIWVNMVMFLGVYVEDLGKNSKFGEDEFFYACGGSGENLVILLGV